MSLKRNTTLDFSTNQIITIVDSKPEEFQRISGEKWKEYCKSGKKPKNIPNSPNDVYKDKGWKSFPDFIGKVHPVQKWLPYQKAREYVVKLNLKNWSEWSEYCKSGKKPINIPNAPKIIYKNKGWKGISDFLGKE